MLERLPRNDRLKVVRAVGGALLGALAALWYLASRGLLMVAAINPQSPAAHSASLPHGAWGVVVVALALGTLAGFILGWRTPRRPAPWQPPPQAGD